MEKKKQNRLFYWFKVLGIAALLFLILFYPCLLLMDFFCPFPMDLLENNVCSQQIEDCDGKRIMQFLDEREQWNFPITIEEANPFFLKALVCAEDKNFFSHSGIDFYAMLRACWGNLTKTRPFSGASTITMQVVRLLIPRPRVLSSKIIESFQSWQLERIWSKEKILEAYINLTPYGGNITGIEAACRRYFDKSARDLSLAQASLLAGVPQSPNSYRPDRHLDKALKRREYVLRRMQEEGCITKEQKEDSLACVPEIKSFSRSFEAVHFCYAIQKGLPENKKVRTTLDLRIQGIARTALQDKLREYQNREIENGSVVVVENSTGSIRALVGSHDFFDMEKKGQINGVNILRSPGSLLKPFIYTLALEKGHITPGSVLMDIPLLYDDYRPWNYDKIFRGPVLASTALSQSLNIPAVSLQKECTTLALLSFLRSIGFESLQKSPEHYGLSLALGGCEITLMEAMQAYTTLARLGNHIPLRFYEKDKPEESRQMISEACAYMVAEMLKDTSPWKAGEIYLPLQTPSFAWKTGTSSRNKDAWAVVYNPLYTIGVWMGNFDGRSSSALVGIKSSAAVAGKIFIDLMRSQKALWYDKPSQIKTRSVCAASGNLPIPEICPNTIEDTYIPGVSKEKICSIHTLAEVDSKTGYMLCPSCRVSASCSKVFEKWPNQAQTWFKEKGNPNLLPEHNPLCQKRPIQESLTIYSPKDKTRYIYCSSTQEQHIFLEAKGTSSKKLFWFVDGLFFQESLPSTKVLYPLTQGQNKS